ncbi:MAG: hypothetical protein H0T65_01760 [Deltaproteobacteria bacterium]|nr:hypothetical protein [Deltaproteobacteria bacterium]
MRIIVVSIVLMLASAANAQRAPDMATLDRGDGISKFGIDGAISSIDSPFYDAALRFELYGQYVTDSGFGFYGAFPLAHSFGEEDDPDLLPDPTTSIGNLELGGLFVITNNPRLSWVFRLGVALPTASDDRDGAATNFYATFPRLTDLALAVPNAWYGRISVSPLIHVDNVFLRVDLGFDIGFDDDDAADELLRFNLGGGIDLGVVALSLELANLYDLDDFDDNNDWVHTLAFTVRFMGERLQPFLSLGAPIDDARDAIPFFFAAGIQYAQ